MNPAHDVAADRIAERGRNPDTRAGGRSERTKNIPYLDGWRGVAILLVLGGHFLKLPASRLGVEVFFVLSGLLMAKVLFEDKTPLGTFYKNRIARIFPTFFLYLAAAALIARMRSDMQPGQFLYNAVFLRAYMPAEIVGTGHQMSLGHLWSLNVEEHSYVLLSLIALSVRTLRGARIALTAAALACVVMYVLYSRLASPAFVNTDAIFRTECAAFPLLASAALRLWLMDIRLASARTLVAISAIGIAIVVVYSRHVGGALFLDYIGKPFALAVMVNTLYAAPAWAHRALSMVWLRWFGICSYSLYLWQQLFFQSVEQREMNLVFGLILAVALGACSFYFFEQPTRRAIRAWNSRSRSKPDAGGINAS